MVTTLYLVRHGETEGSDVNRYKGRIDVPLSGRGIRQIEGASGFIAEDLTKRSLSKYQSYLRSIHKMENAGKDDDRLSAVYCSDLARAKKSAQIIAAPFGLSLGVVPALRERNFGIWEGMSFDEIREKYPEEFEAWAGNPLKFSPVGGENTIEMKERVVAAIDEIIGRHGGEKIAVVAHGGTNRIILCHLLGVSLENIFRIEQDYAAVNIVEFWEKYPVVKLMNGGWGGRE